MNRKLLFWCGIVGPLLYVFTMVLGGVLRPGYSHVGNAISELTQAGAPNHWLLDPLYVIYNLCSVGFGIGILLAARRSSRAGRWAGVCLTVLGALGVLMVWFPMDPLGAPATFAGTGHLVIAGLMSLGTMIAVLLTALWQRHLPGQSRYVRYTVLSLGLIFVSGGLAAAMAASSHPWMGLVERITIGAFLQWEFITAWRMLEHERVAQARPFRPQNANA